MLILLLCMEYMLEPFFLTGKVEIDDTVQLGSFISDTGGKDRASAVQFPKPTPHQELGDGGAEARPQRAASTSVPHGDTLSSSRYPPRPSTARPNIDLGIKTQVDWFDDTQYYALRASSDTRFRVQHAPIPEPGSPWPMPQLYQPYNVSFRVSPHGFEFHSVGEPCELLETNFRRIRKNIFGDVEGEAAAATDGGKQPTVDNRSAADVRTLNVTVLKECSEFPYLEMDESCNFM